MSKDALQNKKSADDLADSPTVHSTDAPVVPSNQKNTASAEVTDQPPVPETDRLTITQIKAWKEAGDYEKIEHQIRNGNIELVPTENFNMLLDYSQRVNKEKNILLNTFSQLLSGFSGFLDNHEKLEEYIDPNSRFLIDVSKIMKEVSSAKMKSMTAGVMSSLGKNKNNQGVKNELVEGVPILKLLMDSFDFQKLQNIDFDSLHQVTRDNDIEDMEKYIQVIQKLTKKYGNADNQE